MDALDNAFFASLTRRGTQTIMDEARPMQKAAAPRNEVAPEESLDVLILKKAEEEQEDFMRWYKGKGYDFPVSEEDLASRIAEYQEDEDWNSG